MGLIYWGWCNAYCSLGCMLGKTEEGGERRCEPWDVGVLVPLGRTPGHRFPFPILCTGLCYKPAILTSEGRGPLWEGDTIRSWNSCVQSVSLGAHCEPSEVFFEWANRRRNEWVRQEGQEMTRGVWSLLTVWRLSRLELLYSFFFQCYWHPAVRKFKVYSTEIWLT